MKRTEHWSLTSHTNCLWRYFLFLSHGVIFCELHPLVSSDACLAEPFNTLDTKPISFCIVLTACTHLIRLFNCTAGNLSSVFHKKIIYDVSLCTVLAANWTSNDSNLGGERRGAADQRAGGGDGRRGLGRAQHGRRQHEVALGRGQAALAEGVQTGQQLGRPALDILVAHGASVQQVEPGRLASALRVRALPTLGLVLPARRCRGPPSPPSPQPPPLSCPGRRCRRGRGSEVPACRRLLPPPPPTTSSSSSSQAARVTRGRRGEAAPGRGSLLRPRRSASRVARPEERCLSAATGCAS